MKEMSSPKTRPGFLSVILCTYNRASSLRRTLDSLARQTLGPAEFELIVVDDSSTDNTAEVCRQAGKLMSNLRYFPTGRNIGVGNAANLGIRNSAGEYLACLDDDCIAREDWAGRMRDALKKHPLVAGCVETPRSNFVKDCHNVAEFHTFMKGRKEGKVDFIAGANMGFRRSVFEEVKGFQTKAFLAGDMAFILEARLRGYEIQFIPEAVITHDHNRTRLSTIFRYSAEHASQTILLRNKYSSLLKTPFIFRSPVLILAAAPVIALKVTAGIYLRHTHRMRFLPTVPVVYALKLAWCWGAARGLKNWNKAAGKP